MKNITYLLGAGASYNSLPVLANISIRLRCFSEDLQTLRLRTDYDSRVMPIVNDVNWVRENIENHQTIDTFAKKLFSRLDTHDQLLRLKRVLSIYFIYDQLEFERNSIHPNVNSGKRELPDKRYDSFIATLTQNGIDNRNLLGNVNVLTWNYDIQLEMAFMNYWDILDLEEARKDLQSIPGQWCTQGNSINLDPRLFSIIHLNGVAGFFTGINSNTSSLIFRKYKAGVQLTEIWTDLIDFFHNFNTDLASANPNSPMSYLNYSWENTTNNYNNPNPLSRKTILKALEIADKTDVLVVIGYSFPTFNRQVDKDIIGRMKRLRRVYVQDKDAGNISSVLEHGFNLKEKIASKGVKDPIRSSTGVGQFIIPPEMWE